MRISAVTTIFFAISIQAHKTHNRGRRNINFNEFVHHTLANNNNYPREFGQLHPNFGGADFVVNVNHQNPKSLSSCPCERYVRSLNNILECLCPSRAVYSKCVKSTVCVLKRFCDHGLLFDTGVLQSVVNHPIELCDESTHTCCLPPIEIRQETKIEEHNVTNYVIRPFIDTIDRTIGKYIVSGNSNLNNSPSPQTTLEQPQKYFQLNQLQSGQIQSSHLQPHQMQVNQSQPGQIQDRQFQSTLLEPNHFQSGHSQPGDIQLSQTLPNQFKTSQIQAGQLQGSQIQPDHASNSSESSDKFKNTDKESSTESAGGVDLVFTSTEVIPSRRTKAPSLLRPTRPPIDTPTQSISEIETTEFEVGILNSATDSNEESSTNDSLNPDELANIFGTQPSLSAEQSEIEDQNIDAKNNVGLNTPRTVINPTTRDQIPIIGQRINVEEIAHNYPTAAPAFNQVQEDIFDVQKSIVLELIPPAKPVDDSNLDPEDTKLILKTCPATMKCVQDMYCTAEGNISTVPVIPIQKEEHQKNSLLSCSDEYSGRVGKCCFHKNT